MLAINEEEMKRADSDNEDDDEDDVISIRSQRDERKRETVDKIFKHGSLEVKPIRFQRRATVGGTTDMTQAQKVVEFFQILTVCHDCLPEKVTVDGREEIFYQSQSPD